MLLFIFTLSITLILIGVAFMFRDEFNNLKGLLSIVCGIGSGLCCFVLFIMLIVGVFVNIGNDGYVASMEQRYKSLVYQLENDLYDNDNDFGKKELYDQIRDWNEDLAKNKKMQRDPWLGMFYPDIYDSFEFIKFD